MTVRSTARGAIARWNQQEDLLRFTEVLTGAGCSATIDADRLELTVRWPATDDTDTRSTS